MLVATSQRFLTETSYYHLQPCLTRNSVLRSSKLGVISMSLSWSGIRMSFCSFTGCSAWRACYALHCKQSGLNAEGKHLPERAGGSGRLLLTPRYCTSALFSLRGIKCQDKFKCQASREACQSWGEHPPWSKDQPLQDQTPEKCVALSCACRTQ